MPLADAIEDVLSGRPGIFGIYARNLGTGETVAINADRILPAESPAKTFVLVHYARLVRSASIDPAVRMRLDGSTRYPGTGVLRYMADGLEPTLEQWPRSRPTSPADRRQRTSRVRRDRREALPGLGPELTSP